MKTVHRLTAGNWIHRLALLMVFIGAGGIALLGLVAALHYLFDVQIENERGGPPMSGEEVRSMFFFILPPVCLSAVIGTAILLQERSR